MAAAAAVVVEVRVCFPPKHAGDITLVSRAGASAGFRSGTPERAPRLRCDIRLGRGGGLGTWARRRRCARTRVAFVQTDAELPSQADTLCDEEYEVHFITRV